MSNPIRQLFPLMIEHEGVWEGIYRHIGIDGELEDEHESRVECIFPTDGDIVYIQKNTFEWADGKTVTTEFGGVIRDKKIWWDTETFSGYGWQSENCILLKLDRKDVPGASFTEVIVLASDGKSRARTWHWFKDGSCYKRTLCDERKVLNTNRKKL